MENQIDTTQEQNLNSTREKQKKQLIIMMVIMGVVIIGILLIQFGAFSSDEKTTQEGDLTNFTPPQAKNSDLEEKKYGTNFSNSMNDQNDEETKSMVSEFTGNKPKYNSRSNENLTENDYKQVQSKIKPNAYSTSHEAKLNTQKKTTQISNKAKYLNSYYADENTQIFKKSPEELREEKLKLEEKELNQQTANLVLDQLKRTNQNQQPIPNNPITNQNITETPSYPTTNSSTQLVPQTARNTIGNPFAKGFYTQSTAIPNTSFDDNSGIAAVIHGNADGIQVTNGSNIKIRLLDNTNLISNESKILLPKHTLLTGIVNIRAERVMISINSIQQNNSIYPVQILVYDIDGSQGLYIPHSKEKQLIATSLSNTTNRGLSGGIFLPTGSVATQVGTQLALQAAQSTIQGVQNYARNKSTNPKVTIKSNYKIILKTGNLETLTAQ